MQGGATALISCVIRLVSHEVEALTQIEVWPWPGAGVEGLVPHNQSKGPAILHELKTREPQACRVPS